MVDSAHLAGGVAFAGAVGASYRDGQTDYWIEPIVAVDDEGLPVGRIQDGDVTIFCCRRGEREIQLTEAFVDAALDRFPRRDFQQLLFVTLTLYHDKFAHLPVAFAPAPVRDTLGDIASRAGLRQLRIAESEKYAHVTFFLDGGNHQPCPGQDNVRVPSPHGKRVEEAPELSLAEVTRAVVRGMAQGYDLVVANFANGDVVGHTQSRAAKIECARLVDARLGQVLLAAREAGYVTLVVADHGNLEEMVRGDGTPHVSHTANPVPFLLVDPWMPQPATVRDGALRDVAPTVLHALGLAQPEAMSGVTLVPGYEWGGQRRVLVLILDGWGLGKEDESNPVWLAPTPVWDGLLRGGSWSRLEASGEAVGLRRGKPGNSEAGHMNIGAGRVVLQDDVRLDLAMDDGSFSRNEILCGAIDEAKRRGTRLHLIGLLSEKSSHGSIEYPLALARMAGERGVKAVYVHLILDGRSTVPGSAPGMLEELDGRLGDAGAGRIATCVGRGIALDRDGDYDKTQRAYDALVFGVGRPCATG